MKIATCGVSHYVPKYYLKKREFTNFEISGYENSDYIIITNRATINLKNKKLLNCFDKHDGEEIFYVSRNGVILSSFRKTSK